MAKSPLVGTATDNTKKSPLKRALSAYKVLGIEDPQGSASVPLLSLPLSSLRFWSFLGSHIFLFLVLVGTHPSVTCWEGSGSDLKLAICNCLPNGPIFIKTY